MIYIFTAIQSMTILQFLGSCATPMELREGGSIGKNTLKTELTLGKSSFILEKNSVL